MQVTTMKRSVPEARAHMGVAIMAQALERQAAQHSSI